MTTEKKDIQKYLENPESVYYRASLQSRPIYNVGGLVAISPDKIPPEIAIVNGARTSFLGQAGDLGKDKKLLKYLYRNQHSSPLELSDILLNISLSLKNYLQLLEDTRFKMFTYKVDINEYGEYEIYLRTDINNATRYYTLYKDDVFNDLIPVLTDIFKKFYPWLCEELGIEAETEIRKYEPHASPRRNIDLFSDPKMGWVELQNTLGNDELIADIYTNTFESYGLSTDEIIQRLFESGDLRVLSLFTVQFRLQAPTVVWWQLVRHRTFSFSLQSGRYTPFKEDEYFIPNTWRKQSKSNKQASDGEFSDEENTLYSIYLLNYANKGFELYESLLTSGGSKEQARFFLPAWISPYQGVVKVDLMYFLRFLRLRLDTHAQIEIRKYAEAMYDLWAESMPITAKYAKEYDYKGS